jgi:rhodanese-related sulfurtransferase
MKILTQLAIVSSLLLTQVSALHIEGVKVMLDEAILMVDETQPKELKKMIEAEEEFFLIDIRGEAQKHRGEIYHIDSYQIPRGYLEFQIEEKIKNKKSKIVIYCCSGQRSILAAKSLKRMGYKNVTSLATGLKGWIEVGLPLDTVYGEMILKPEK